MEPLLSIKKLNVKFHTTRGTAHILKNISFSMNKEKVGIVGESGSGKSMTARAILRLIRYPGTTTADELTFRNQFLLSLSEKKMRSVRGRQISMVMQDPRYSLNPVMTVGKQIEEAYRVHSGATRKQARLKTLEMLNAVQIRDPERVYNTHPHEVSGGMGQRIMIAMMLIPKPDLLIADEPTSALDVTVQMQVLKILDDIVTDRGMGLIFISHDLNLVSSFCDRVIVMYAGKIVEELDACDLKKAQHNYTKGLLACLPSFETTGRDLPVLQRDPAWLE